MLRCLFSRCSLRCVPGAALSVALVSFPAAPAAAQFTNPKPPVERYDDPAGNGIAVGTALGAIGGVVATAQLFTSRPGVLESAPGDRDPSWDGLTKGALIGAGAMAGLLAVNYARCDAGCEAPAEGPMYAWGLSIGAGGGAAVGWLIDRLHVARKPMPIAVAVRADKQARAVRVQWRF